MFEPNHIYQGNTTELVKQLDDESINCCVTSPPYYALRNYNVDGQLGLENTPEEYVSNMVKVFSEVKRALRSDGVFWLNIGDSYYNYRPGKGQSMPKQTVATTNQDLPQTCARRGNKLEGLKEKDLIGIPWLLAFALRADGWYLRQDIIWAKPNPMPESIKDRPTRSHEYLFLLTKSKNYYFNSNSIREVAVALGKPRSFRKDGKEETLRNDVGNMFIPATDGKRNCRSVWTINTKPFKGAHFAVMPEALVEPCILAGCPENGICLDPFMGAGTVGTVAKRLKRNYLGFELNPAYIKMAESRIANVK